MNSELAAIEGVGQDNLARMISTGREFAAHVRQLQHAADLRHERIEDSFFGIFKGTERRRLRAFRKKEFEVLTLVETLPSTARASERTRILLKMGRDGQVEGSVTRLTA